MRIDVTQEDLPTAVWEGTFTLLGVELHCAVLDDGRRVIDGDDFERFVVAMSEDGHAPVDDAQMAAFARWQRRGDLPVEGQ
jgi:hypothetical protein